MWFGNLVWLIWLGLVNLVWCIGLMVGGFGWLVDVE
jgi:hypothetical protein